METINVNGKEYQEIKTADNHVIAIVPNGWIFIGKPDQNNIESSVLVLVNASIVRKWSNGKGIGGLCKEENKSSYTLDTAGKVTLPFCNINAILDCEW